MLTNMSFVICVLKRMFVKKKKKIHITNVQRAALSCRPTRWVLVTLIALGLMYVGCANLQQQLTTLMCLAL